MDADRSANGSAAASGGIALAVVGLMIGLAVFSIALIIVSIIFALWLAWKAFSAKTSTERLIYGTSSGAVIVLMLIATLSVASFVGQRQAREDVAGDKEQFLQTAPDLIFASLIANRPDWPGPRTKVMSDQKYEMALAVPAAKADIPIKFVPLYTGSEEPTQSDITAYAFKQLDRLHSLPDIRMRYAKCSFTSIRNADFKREPPSSVREFGSFSLVVCKEPSGALIFPALGIGDWSMANNAEFKQAYLKRLCQQYTVNIQMSRKSADWDGPTRWNLNGCNPA